MSKDVSARQVAVEQSQHYGEGIDRAPRHGENVKTTLDEAATPSQHVDAELRAGPATD